MVLAADELVDGRAKPSHDGGEGHLNQGGAAQGRWEANRKKMRRERISEL